MFRKIVSNLSFSPALVGQLAFYAKRLKNEEATRRVGLFFVVLALIVQSLAVFQPAQSANASGSNDFVAGGLGIGSSRSFNKFMTPYDNNTYHLKDIMTYMGITRSEITSTTYTSWIVGDTISWGHEPRYSYAEGERDVAITNASGKKLLTVYGKPAKLNNGANTRIYGWVGHSAHAGWFAIMQACGNLVTKSIPTPPKIVVPVTPPKTVTPTPAPTPTPVPVTTPVTTVPTPVVTPDKCQYSSTILANSSDCKVCPYNNGLWIKSPQCVEVCKYNGDILASSSDCRPCPGSPNLWIKDTSCIPNITESKKAINVTQGSVDATTVTANGADDIAYTITVKNTGLASAAVPLEEHLQDVLEYATLSDNGGGTYDATTHTLTWPTIQLAASEEQSRSFSVQVVNPIPATAEGATDNTSYDCTMSNVFGNNVEIKVNCPTPKVVEEVVTQLPHTGPTENLIFGGIVFAIATYFYARARQVKKEVRLIRRSVNTGAI